jgi:hypothetical protein
VALERGPLSILSKIEELLGIKSSDSGLESREYGLGIRHADHMALSIRKKLSLASPTSGGRSIGMVCPRTQDMEFSF